MVKLYAFSIEENWPHDFWAFHGYQKNTYGGALENSNKQLLLRRNVGNRMIWFYGDLWVSMYSFTNISLRPFIVVWADIFKTFPESAFISSHYRSSPLEVFLGKGALKIRSKFTGEHPCWSATKVALQLYWSSASAWVFSCKFAAYFQYNFSQERLWRAAFVINNCFFIFWNIIFSFNLVEV